MIIVVVVETWNLSRAGYPQQKHHKRWVLEVLLVGKVEWLEAKNTVPASSGCPNYGCWNRVPVNKVFVERCTSEITVTILTPTYRPLFVSFCRKCGKVLPRPAGLIAIRSHVK